MEPLLTTGLRIELNVPAASQINEGQFYDRRCSAEVERHNSGKDIYSRDGAGKGPHGFFFFFTVAAQRRSWEVLFLNFWAFWMAVVDVWIWKSFEFRELKAAAASGCGRSESRAGSAPRTAPPQGDFLRKKRVYSFKMSYFCYLPNT